MHSLRGNISRLKSLKYDITIP